MSEGYGNSLAAGASMNGGDGLWQACVDQLAQELPEQQFNTWIKPLVAKVSDDFSKVTLYVANRFKLDWVRAQYAGRIAATLEKIYGQPVQLELALAQRESPARPYVAPAAPQIPTAPEVADPAAPGQLYNPLVIYGGVVLGNTHRVHAVGNKLLADRPGSKVLYIHAEQ